MTTDQTPATPTTPARPAILDSLPANVGAAYDSHVERDGAEHAAIVAARAMFE